MGQRANILLVRGESQDLFYCHWCANTLDEALFWGPERAVAFARRQEPVDKEGWLDNVWAEGGAVIDEGRRALLLFGGEDILYDIPLRRVFLDLLGLVWEGWEVRWAHEGIAEMADRAGLPRERVLDRKGLDRPRRSLDPPELDEWTDLVGSVRLEDGRLRLFPLGGRADEYLLAGPALLKVAQCEADRRPGWLCRLLKSEWCGVARERIDLGEWKCSFPNSGFHIDVPERAVEFWEAHDVPGAPELIASRWPDWRVVWLRDAYETQLERTGELLRFPARLPEELVENLRAVLLRKAAPNHPLSVVAELDREKGGSHIEVSSSALHHAPQDVPLETREAILNEALAAWRRGRGETSEARR